MCMDFTRWHYFACQAAVATIVFLSLVPGPLGAENWNAWRGPRGDGISMETGLPQRWSDQENVAWKISVPGTGHASPIAWDDRIFLVTCNEQQQERILLCLDRHSGKTNWQQVVLRATLETKHPLNSYASSTPATDGKFVYVSFLEPDGDLVPALNVGTERMVSSGNMVVAAYDLDGRQQWLVRPGKLCQRSRILQLPGDLQESVNRQRRPRWRFVHRGLGTKYGPDDLEDSARAQNS